MKRKAGYLTARQKGKENKQPMGTKSPRSLYKYCFLHTTYKHTLTSAHTTEGKYLLSCALVSVYA